MLSLYLQLFGGRGSAGGNAKEGAAANAEAKATGRRQRNITELFTDKESTATEGKDQDRIHLMGTDATNTALKQYLENSGWRQESSIKNTWVYDKNPAKSNSNTSYSFQSSISSAVKDNNINKATPIIDKAMKTAPVGTEFAVDAYYNAKAGGMLQNVFKKTGKNKWTNTWRVKGGQVYWTNSATSSDIYNAYNK